MDYFRLILSDKKRGKMSYFINKRLKMEENSEITEEIESIQPHLQTLLLQKWSADFRIRKKEMADVTYAIHYSLV
jgi:hypothetical protein